MLIFVAFGAVSLQHISSSWRQELTERERVASLSLPITGNILTPSPLLFNLSLNTCCQVGDDGNEL